MREPNERDHTEAAINTDLGERFRQICEMTDERLRRMSPAERDRMLQVHLAAARGPRRNFALLCQMTDAFASVRRQRLAELRRQGKLAIKPGVESDLDRRIKEAGI